MSVATALPSETRSELPEGAIRTKTGGWLKPFQPGQSGNPLGPSGSEYLEAQRICREATPKAARKMVELIDCEDARVALMASDKVYERAWGKPRESGEDPNDPAAMERRAQLIAAVVALLSGHAPPKTDTGEAGAAKSDAGGTSGPNARPSAPAASASGPAVK